MIRNGSTNMATVSAPADEKIPLGPNGTAYDMDIFFLASWHDDHLGHEKELKILNNKQDLNRVWRPDLYFSNSRKGEFQYAIVPNYVMWIYRNGTVSLSIRVTLKVACNLKLVNYPLDEQVCSLKIMSCKKIRSKTSKNAVFLDAHTERRMKVSWFGRKPIGYNRGIEMPQFVITNVTAEKCDGNHKYATTEQGYLRGDFSCLLAKIHMQRSVGHHIVQTFIPTTLIVCISWVSFWIDRAAIAARVSLSFSALLTLSTMVAGISHELPPVSYVKSIDVWLGTCVLFVFLALVEFAIVNSLMRTAQRYHEMADGKCAKRRSPNLAKYLHENDLYCRTKSDGGIQALSDQVKLKIMIDKYSAMALKVDLISRILFPVVYALFALAYFIVYSK